jgi:LmbE family N-acetylglucosaminyl deacetylase
MLTPDGHVLGRVALLAVFAHPDDESYLSGGTLARYAASGRPVALFSATRGEASADRPPTENPRKRGGSLFDEL